MEVSYRVLRSLASSRLRMSILAALDSPKRLSDLKREVGANAPNTASRARDLQEMGLIERKDGDYRITRMGKIAGERLSLLLETFDAYYEHDEFWLRMLDRLPMGLIESMHRFRGGRVVKSDRTDLDRVKNEIIGHIRAAEGRLLVLLPSKSVDILEEIDAASRKVETRLVTLDDDSDLGYGLVLADDSTILFTEMLDMALVHERGLGAWNHELESSPAILGE